MNTTQSGEPRKVMMPDGSYVTPPLTPEQRRVWLEAAREDFIWMAKKRDEVNAKKYLPLLRETLDRGEVSLSDLHPYWRRLLETHPA